MTRSAHVVIGAGYGDEGKGLLVDALAAPHGREATVIRFNGGAQAGHTVTLADGRRHVFHHVGSGAFVGAATFLSRFFIANPILLARELADLRALGVSPRIAIDPAAPVTTPWDMMINQFVETARGGARHGSCGLGIGETIERSLDPVLSLTASGLDDRSAIRDLARRIRTEWVPRRLAGLGVWPPRPEDLELIGSEAVVERWLDDIEAFRGVVTVRGIDDLSEADVLVFEGAQGLMLDQDRGAFPYVTRSNTGSRNVLALARNAGIDRLDVLYATRAYVTRHGAGPLAHELPGLPDARVVDGTNVPNAWQGSLRFGTLDLDILGGAIADDLSDVVGSGIEVVHGLAVTCLDQVGSRPGYVVGGVSCTASPEALARAAAAAVGADELVVSLGPTRETLARPRTRGQADAVRGLGEAAPARGAPSSELASRGNFLQRGEADRAEARIL